MLHSNPGDYAWGQTGLDAIVTQVRGCLWRGCLSDVSHGPQTPAFLLLLSEMSITLLSSIGFLFLLSGQMGYGHGLASMFLLGIPGFLENDFTPGRSKYLSP